MKLPAQLLQCLAALLSIALVACSHQVGPFPQATFGHRLDMVHSQILFTTTVPVGSKTHGHLHTEQQCVAGLPKALSYAPQAFWLWECTISSLQALTGKCCYLATANSSLSTKCVLCGPAGYTYALVARLES